MINLLILRMKGPTTIFFKGHIIFMVQLILPFLKFHSNIAKRRLKELFPDETHPFLLRLLHSKKFVSA